MAKVTILGAGSWGTALAMLLSHNGHKVTLWSALQAEVTMLQEKREQVERLPGRYLPEDVMVTGDLAAACQERDLTVFAVASPYVRGTARQAAPYIKKGDLIVNVAKGIEERTLSTLSQVLESELPQADIAVLSGPSHAEEVSLGIPTTCVVGAKRESTARIIQDIFMNDDNFRVYTSPDIVGIELGGSVKNVIALAAGIADGLGFGDNTKAALITRGIAEMTRLGVALGGKPETFAGLSGVGDLIVTCTSQHSRNRKAGYLLGKGYSAEEAMREVNQVVEGVYSAKATLQLAREHGIDMPIVEQINAVLFEGKSPKDVVAELVQRDKRAEYPSLKWEN